MILKPTTMDYRQQITTFLKRHHYERVTPVAALIDMDGTLYDSMVNHTAAWHRLATELGIEATRDEFYLYEGMTGAATIRKLFRRQFDRDVSDEECQRLYRLKTEYFRQLPEVKVMPGAQSLLNQMIGAGMKRVLVTGSGQATLLDRLAVDFPGAFSDAMKVTSRNVTHGKPHPEPYIRGMQLAGVSPSASIVVENAPLGVKAGDAAGAFTIAVTTGPISRDEMLEAGAAVVFDSMPGFADQFPQLMLDLFNTSVG